MTSMSLLARLKRNRVTLMQYIAVETVINSVWLVFSLYAWGLSPDVTLSNVFVAWLATNVVAGLLLYVLMQAGIKR